jgi:hypothetical protein
MIADELLDLAHLATAPPEKGVGTGGAVHHVRIEGVVSPLMYADGRYVPFAP